MFGIFDLFAKINFIAIFKIMEALIKIKNSLIFSRVAQFLQGGNGTAPTYLLSRWVFLRAIGFIYLVAFLSLWVQIPGLYGTDGILPAQGFLERVAQNVGSDRFHLLPTVFWWGASEAVLRAVALTGAGLSLILIIGVFPPLVLFLLWAIYLSFLSIGQVFLSFQWDVLLLEAGFLAIFVAPLQLKPGISRESEPRPLAIFLLKWLLFRLMFASGLVKLASGDKTWWDLTALNFHYETQPIPTWTSWFMHHLPEVLQKISVGYMFFIELVIPFLIFAPRRIRYFGFLHLAGFQVLILVTGNYCFFNLITLALCLVLLDDSIYPRKIREKVQKWRDSSPEFLSPNWPVWLLRALAILIIPVTLYALSNRTALKFPAIPPLVKLTQFLRPLHSFNSYGLFAVMTTSRPEIIIEGSNDGKQWKAYEFKWKPGDLSRRPTFVAPHQPRLDWQMWFAALGSYQQNPWFLEFCRKILMGSVPVLDLMENNPFPENPPRILRAVVYDYHFTTPSEKKETGNWWKRKVKGLYCPLLTLREGQLAAVQISNP